ncbi:twin transmembrane helix small protein [Pseudophaeobacter flagellatus]|uniref:twin transmembrane helix small protein n=1 Tax=Pseudophaeobacter flagellatus TaxID=2899119 RepID=UPI001E4ECC45|nr:twin transmembrane helix small protein [Pseudophaeobacter flagellatus]MCD9149439.1 twin transmembrane helix small protein [Pseudophaeobacter flagellatus]
MGDPLYLLAILAMAAVVVVLLLGLGSFGKGGAISKKYGNKLMRLRLFFQFIAVVLLVTYVYLRGQSGQ